MNIGFFTDSYRPYISGVVRSIDTFRKELTKMGHRVYIFAPNYPNCPKEEGVYRFASLPSPTHPDFTLAIPFSLQLRRTLKKLDLQVIHTHSPFLLGKLGAKYAKRNNIPLVTTYHTLYEQYTTHYVPFARSISSKVVKKYTIDYCNECDLVVAPTNIIKDGIISGGVKTPVEVIPTGVDLDEYSKGDPSLLRQQLGKGPDTHILLSVGRLGYEKNIDFLLRAFQKILSFKPNTHLVLAGGGPQQSEFQQLAKDLGIDRYVTFAGMLPRHKLVNAYLGADLFVFASVTETQGLVIGEAKAAGLPVVAVDANGVSEMVKHGEDGYLTPCREDLFSKSVLEILDNESLRRNMAVRALKNAQALSSYHSAMKLLAAYHFVCLANSNRAAAF